MTMTSEAANAAPTVTALLMVRRLYALQEEKRDTAEVTMHPQLSWKSCRHCGDPVESLIGDCPKCGESLGGAVSDLSKDGIWRW